MENKLPQSNILLRTFNQLTKRDLIFIVVIILLVGLVGFMSWSSDKPQMEDIPGNIDVEIPGRKSSGDTVYMPVEVIRDTTIYKENRYNKELEAKFLASQDSIEKLNMYIEAITERDYKQNFKDGYQDITVSSKVRGKLLSQHVAYEVFPQTVKVDTVFSVEVKQQRKLYGLVELGAPLQIKQNHFKGKGTLIFKNKKDQLFSAAVSTDAYVWFGAGVKF